MTFDWIVRESLAEEMTSGLSLAEEMTSDLRLEKGQSRPCGDLGPEYST